MPTFIETLEAFPTALTAHVHSPDIPAAADAYGWFVGSWELDVIRYWGMDVTAQRIKGEVHASWVLQGYAVQDVWIMPRRSDRSGDLDKKMNMYGSTLRVWDPTIQAWRITWRNPAGDHHEDQIGRRQGKDIIQLGTHPDGTKTRWSFVEITNDSFHWLGEAMEPNASKWILLGEFRATRM